MQCGDFAILTAIYVTFIHLHIVLVYFIPSFILCFFLLFIFLSGLRVCDVVISLFGQLPSGRLEVAWFRKALAVCPTVLRLTCCRNNQYKRWWKDI